MRFLYLIVFAVVISMLSLIAIVTPAEADDPIIGEIRIYAGPSPPAGWEIADGTLRSKTTYSELYSVITDTYNTTTPPVGQFYLPNLSRTMPVGVGNDFSGDWSYGFDLGDRGGNFTVGLDVGELPAHHHLRSGHTHTIPDHNHDLKATNNTANSPGPLGRALAVPSTNIYRDTGGPPPGTMIDGSISTISGTVTGTGGFGNSQNTGSNVEHRNMPPYLALNFIIYTGVGLPTPTPTNTPTSTPTPTITPTPVVITGTTSLSYISAYTQTLTSDQTLLIPVSMTFGQIIISAALLCLIAVFVIIFVFKLVYRQ